jgi:hypothetical protein
MAVDAINNITDQLFEIGSCKEFNRLYEDVRTPLCDELSSAMDAFWIACFLAGPPSEPRASMLASQCLLAGCRMQAFSSRWFV